ncbi:hypothetical protein BJX99DRAFT_222018 [Aspergillus californicus]
MAHQLLYAILIHFKALQTYPPRPKKSDTVSLFLLREDADSRPVPMGAARKIPTFSGIPKIHPSCRWRYSRILNCATPARVHHSS